MRRRDLIASVFVMAACGARAQQSRNLYRIAIVSPSTAVADMSETGTEPFLRALFRELGQIGYVEGRNLVVERYSGEGQTDLYAQLAGGLTDPVADGIVSNLARPGANITGVVIDAGAEIWGKRLQILREAIPGLARVGIIILQGQWNSAIGLGIRNFAQQLGIVLVAPSLAGTITEAEFRRVFAVMIQDHAQALIVSDAPENQRSQELIVKLAEQSRLPAMYPFRSFAEFGGSMAYSTDLAALGPPAAAQIDKILRGTPPGDLPFYQSIKFELIVNMKTAQTMRIDMPRSLIQRADEILE
jgi:putative ABC transport system substrate-binding protein